MRFLLLGLLVFFVAVPEAQASCVDEDIDRAVREHSIKRSEQAVALTKQIDLGIEKTLIKPNRREVMINTALEYFVRKSDGCAIPERLNATISEALLIGKVDGEVCEAGQYATSVNRQFRTLKSAGGYEVFEQIVKEQVSGLIIAEAGVLFTERWQNDPAFRETAIKAGLEMGVMQVSGCSNPEAPILKVISDF